MTCGADGKILWWDTRQMAVPLDSMQLYATNTKPTTTAAGGGTNHHRKAGNDDDDSSNSTSVKYTSIHSPTLLKMSGLCFDYSPQAGPAKFLVGTGQGVVLAGNRKAKTKAEAITARYPGHHGAIVSVCRNPFLPKYFLTIGDWTAKVWAEDAKHALVSTPYQTSQLTAGCWSPSKPGVYWTGSNDGCVQVWDVLQNRKDAQVVARVADAAVTAMAISGGGGGASSLSSNPSSSAHSTPSGGRQLAAVGCNDGSISLLRPSDSLLYELSDEKSGLVSALERECAREKGLEKLSRDAKVRARKVQVDGGKKKENVRSLEAVSKYDLEDLERQFYVQFGVKKS
jgi:dynein intermediate chain 2